MPRTRPRWLESVLALGGWHAHHSCLRGRPPCLAGMPPVQVVGNAIAIAVELDAGDNLATVRQHLVQVGRQVVGFEKLHLQRHAQTTFRASGPGAVQYLAIAK